MPTKKYTFKEEGGNVGVFESGGRIATTTPGLAKTQYGYTPQTTPAPAVPTDIKPTAITNPTPAPAPVSVPELPQPQAPGIQSTFVTSLTGQAEQARTAFDEARKRQLEDVNSRIATSEKRLSEITDKQDAMIETDIQPLMQPFREELENAERERLHINENFEANQKLTRELDTLLTEGNELIRGERNRFASRSSINAGVGRALEDVAARSGVIQAVMSARSGQIAEAERMIDRSVEAITADRKDRISYFSTLLEFSDKERDTEGNKLLDLTKEQRALINADLAMLEKDLEQADANANYIKGLMMDPETASIVASAGVTLKDTPEQIAVKLSGEMTRREIENTKRELAVNGYTYMPFGGAGTVAVPVGGQTLYFKAPPEKVKAGAGATSTSIKLTPEDNRNLVGAGFTPQDIQNIQSDVAAHGIDAVLEGITDAAQKNAIRKVYGTPTTITLEQLQTQVTQKAAQDGLKSTFTEEELIDLAKANGFASLWKNRATEVQDFINSPAARTVYIDLLYKQYQDAGLAN